MAPISSAQPAEARDHHLDVEATLRKECPESSGSSGAPRPAEFRGRFILYDDGQPQATLTPDELLQFVLQGSVDIPVIPKSDIEDRSKGDILSKGVAILQLVWFVCQWMSSAAPLLLPVVIVSAEDESAENQAGHVGI
ncbi:hypothetical protein DEU56DRAFT_985325 [Suillus clintonianus]|uniref:uncharacterized protein n=1 Tax=Suillus clintonianus TaxID=1904413 RepID=UPI001B861BB4|nr:uncharacterized protein DEU56DRAFT_985325 [Suillus clintonianus]KAG2111745.1 hypothetical protein DEU56DRAFT_985325 [Suillus clintonianus]